MGRKDAVQFTLELVAEWRRLGALVTFEPGWETRGNGTSANYEGGNVHHTGFGSSESNSFPARNTLIGGRPDLSGPLCNTAGPWCPPDQPHIHVIAAHPANHAGASGGPGTAPMPVTSLFNPRSWGHEIDYGGNVAMVTGQRLAALIVTKGLANVLARSTEYMRAHAETSVTGKWDPGYTTGKTIDMAAFRRDAANFQGDDMPLSSDDINAISVVVKKWVINVLRDEKIISWPDGSSVSIAQQTADNKKAIDSLTALVKGLGSDTSSGAKLPTEFDLSSMARAVADELDRRARDGDASTGPVS